MKKFLSGLSKQELKQLTPEQMREAAEQYRSAAVEEFYKRKATAAKRRGEKVSSRKH